MKPKIDEFIEKHIRNTPRPQTIHPIIIQWTHVFVAHAARLLTFDCFSFVRPNDWWNNYFLPANSSLRFQVSDDTQHRHLCPQKYGIVHFIKCVPKIATTKNPFPRLWSGGVDRWMVACRIILTHWTLAAIILAENSPLFTCNGFL